MRLTWKKSKDIVYQSLEFIERTTFTDPHRDPKNKRIHKTSQHI
jgi:hypothetical protein